jgi:hypothetical protein
MRLHAASPALTDPCLARLVAAGTSLRAVGQPGYVGPFLDRNAIIGLRRMRNVYTRDCVIVPQKSLANV